MGVSNGGRQHLCAASQGLLRCVVFVTSLHVLVFVYKKFCMVRGILNSLVLPYQKTCHRVRIVAVAQRAAFLASLPGSIT